MLKEIVFTFFIAGILAYLIFRPVMYFEKKGIKRVWSILIVYFIVIGFILISVWFAAPRIMDELTEVASMLPRYADQAEHMVDEVEKMPLPHKLDKIVDDNIAQIENYIYNGINNLLGGVYDFLTRVIALIFSPILAFYILKDWEYIRDSFLEFLPPGAKKDTIVIADEIDSVLVEFLKGHLLVAGIVGLLVGLAAVIIGVKYPVIIGVIAGVSNLVPYFGPILGGIPAIGIALSESLALAIYMFIALVLVQQVEANVITPRIIGDKLGINPLTIVFALLAGGKLFGLIGLLLAVPVMASLKVIVKFAYLKIVEQ
ncbi:AI-2E family transporter [Candidatus Syntrophocurvum alkaliphilum]|uniref:AI-2E family transporter n=1 Tax=Candidatus Syntrophocurvum alkaliphilum TaxID=2293317 RepID=UPI001FA983B6|nr:AI-2E family transporter [Candidatus Syntrophocurvum alkaliphilum]